MANLGDNNTPVEGESFGLPSGFSIDENSGNLAIRDTNGNVVAEWDETNAQWDFANNTLNNVDALNSNSVNTGGLTVTDDLTLTTTGDISPPGKEIFEAESNAGGGLIRLSALQLEGDNSATQIIDGRRGGLIIIDGNVDEDITVAFTDILVISSVTEFGVISSEERNNPGARAYSESGGFLEISIDDAGTNYNVRAEFIGGAIL